MEWVGPCEFESEVLATETLPTLKGGGVGDAMQCVSSELCKTKDFKSAYLKHIHQK